MLSDNRKLLILDIDETLVHASERPLDRKADFTLGNYFVYRRPFLSEFLAWSMGRFQVALWTSGSQSYAAEIAKMIYAGPSEFAFIWSQERCTWCYDTESQEHYWRKELKKVKRKGYDLSSVLIVDDKPVGLRHSYGNLIRVKPFYGDENDLELWLLRQYLETIKDVENVRTIEKRGWRIQVAIQPDELEARI